MGMTKTKSAEYVHPLDAAYAASEHSKDCLDHVVYRMYVNYMTDHDHSNAESVRAATQLLRDDPEWCRADDWCHARR